MRVLGIDPGSRMTGWGIVEERGTGFHHLASGTLTLGSSSSAAMSMFDDTVCTSS